MTAQQAADPGPRDGDPTPRTVLLASRDPAVVIRMRRALTGGAGQFRLVGVIDPTIEATLLTWCDEVDVVLIDSDVLLQLMRRDAAGMREATRRTLLVVLMHEKHVLEVMIRQEGRIAILFLDGDSAMTADVIALAVDGYVSFPAPLLRRLVSNEMRREIAGRLSMQERRILGFLAEAVPNDVIASRVGLSEGRIKSMVTLLIRKLHVHNRTALAVFAASCQISARKEGVRAGGTPSGKTLSGI